MYLWRGIIDNVFENELNFRKKKEKKEIIRRMYYNYLEYLFS